MLRIVLDYLYEHYTYYIITIRTNVCDALHQLHSAFLADPHLTTLLIACSIISDERCSLNNNQLPVVYERVFRSTVDTLLHNNQLPMTHLVSQIMTSLPTMSITRSTIDSDDKTTVSDSASTSFQGWGQFHSQ